MSEHRKNVYVEIEMRSSVNVSGCRNKFYIAFWLTMTLIINSQIDVVVHDGKKVN